MGGFHIFNAANDDHSVNLTTIGLLERFYAGVPVRRELGEFESLYSNAKAKAMLGWRERHNWRKYTADPRNAVAEPSEPSAKCQNSRRRTVQGRSARHTVHNQASVSG